MFKFIHSADIHLDSPMRGLAAYELAPVDAMRGASRSAMANLVGLAIEEGCAFIVIAGDLFDGSWRDVNTALFFAKQMARLKEHNIKVFIAFGNHDAESQLKKMPWPDNVFVFPSRKAQTEVLDELAVAVHGRSFGRKEITENLAQSYPAPLDGHFNIAVLHTALEGHPNHDNYAPCKLSDLVTQGFNYWALGHVHEYSIRHENPHVVFSGNLQGRSIRETGEKGCVLVSVDEGEIVDIEHRIVDAARWQSVHIDLSTAQSVSDLQKTSRQELEKASALSEGRPVAVRLTFSGKTSLHADILRGERAIVEELRVNANGLSGDIWIEKVKFETSFPMAPEAIVERDDAISELIRTISVAADDKDLVAALRGELAPVLEKLPADSNSDVASEDVISLATGDDLAPLFERATEQLIAELTGDD